MKITIDLENVEAWYEGQSVAELIHGVVEKELTSFLRAEVKKAIADQADHLRQLAVQRVIEAIRTEEAFRSLSS